MYEVIFQYDLHKSTHLTKLTKLVWTWLDTTTRTPVKEQTIFNIATYIADHANIGLREDVK